MENNLLSCRHRLCWKIAWSLAQHSHLRWAQTYHPVPSLLRPPLCGRNSNKGISREDLELPLLVKSGVFFLSPGVGFGVFSLLFLEGEIPGYHTSHMVPLSKFLQVPRNPLHPTRRLTTGDPTGGGQKGSGAGRGSIKSS